MTENIDRYIEIFLEAYEKLGDAKPKLFAVQKVDIALAIMKEVGKDLRQRKIDVPKMTEKQLGLLKKLYPGKDFTGLSKEEASALIDEYYKNIKKVGEKVDEKIHQSAYSQ